MKNFFNFAMISSINILAITRILILRTDIYLKNQFITPVVKYAQQMIIDKLSKYI